MRYWASSEGRPAARLRRGCRVRAAPAQWRRSRELIMKIGPLPDVMDSGFHGVRTRWIWGFSVSGWWCLLGSGGRGPPG